MITFKKNLLIPKVWGDLMAIEDFDLLKSYPSKAPINAKPSHVKDPTPYREDYREAELKEGKYMVIMSLNSGSNNYWLNYIVLCKGKKNDFSDATTVYEFGEPFFDIPSKDQLTFRDQTIAFGIEIESPAKPC